MSQESSFSMNQLPRGILLDLDDTLISFDEGAGFLWAEICEEFSSENNSLNSRELLQAINRSRESFWKDSERHKKGRLNLQETRRKILKNALSLLGIANLALSDSIADTFSERRLSHLSLFPGTIETLEQLQAKGVVLGLVTNGDSQGQRSKIKKFDLSKFFECIFIEEEVGFGKPDKRIYLHALEALGLSTDEIWFVGDNLEWDVKAPQSLGIWSIWNDYKKRGIPENCAIKPNRIINNVIELIEE